MISASGEDAPGAAIVAVGTELVADGRPDSNGVAISRLLAARGIATRLRTLVPDDENEIARVLAEAARSHRLILVTGGLGPTLDDVTREAAALAFGLTLAEDPQVAEELAAKMRSRGRELTAAGRRQAMVPVGAEPLPNSAGTAPGIALTLSSGTRVFLMPGVPHEMQRMMVEQVLPRLGTWARAPLAWRGLKAAGLTEVQVQERVRDLVDASPGASLTILASPMEITLILRADDPRDVDRMARLAAARLGDDLVTEDLSVGVEDVAGHMLERLGLTLATAESCTGGLLGSLVTRVPGSSRWFLQGWVTYANEAKIRALGVPADLLAAHGAVSGEVAEAMASRAKLLSGASRSLSITGVAGPDGGTPEKPVGLVFIGLASEDGCLVTRHHFLGDRETIRLFAARMALDRLRRSLQEDGGRS
ncbi:MAG: CinA family nicotinamide mononucleotide deamidase-related protein [Candidatus Polarisedimenticolia bacterium]